MADWLTDPSTLLMLGLNKGAFAPKAAVNATVAPELKDLPGPVGGAGKPVPNQGFWDKMKAAGSSLLDPANNTRNAMILSALGTGIAGPHSPVAYLGQQVSGVANHLWNQENVERAPGYQSGMMDLNARKAAVAKFAVTPAGNSGAATSPIETLAQTSPAPTASLAPATNSATPTPAPMPVANQTTAAGPITPQVPTTATASPMNTAAAAPVAQVGMPKPDFNNPTWADNQILGELNAQKPEAPAQTQTPTPTPTAPVSQIPAAPSAPTPAQPAQQGTTPPTMEDMLETNHKLIQSQFNYLKQAVAQGHMTPEEANAMYQGTLSKISESPFAGQEGLAKAQTATAQAQTAGVIAKYAEQKEVGELELNKARINEAIAGQGYQTAAAAHLKVTEQLEQQKFNLDKERVRIENDRTAIMKQNANTDAARVSLAKLDHELQRNLLISKDTNDYTLSATRIAEETTKLYKDPTQKKYDIDAMAGSSYFGLGLQALSGAQNHKKMGLISQGESPLLGTGQNFIGQGLNLMANGINKAPDALSKQRLYNAAVQTITQGYQNVGGTQKDIGNAIKNFTMKLVPMEAKSHLFTANEPAFTPGGVKQ